MPTQLSDVHVGLVSFVDRAAQRSGSDPTQPQRFLLYKAEGADNEGSTDMPDTINKDELDPAVREALEKAEQEAADATARAEAAEKAEADAKAELEKAGAGGGTGGGKDDGREADDDKRVSKAELEKLSPEVRAIVEKAEADRVADRERLEKAEARAENAETLAKAETERREVGEFVSKAETGELRGIPGEPGEIAKAMHTLSKAAPEAWAVLEKDVLTPAAAQIRAGEVMKQQGVGGEGPPPESALAKFNGKVADLMKADSTLKKSDAMERVRKAEPELQQAIAEEMGSAGATA